MPIYEYSCPKCGDFEVTQRITEAPLRKCPTCRSKVKKLISSTSFQLKGSGWYATDYARKGDGGGKDKPADSKAESKSDTSSKSDSGGDSKAGSKSDTSKASSKSGTAKAAA